MNADALPYTLLLVLTELAVGGLWVLWGAHVRGHVARSFVQFSSFLVAVVAALALLAALKVSVPAEVDGYALDGAFMGPARLLLAVALGLATAYSLATLTPGRLPALALGGAASLAGLGAIAALAGVFSPPVWGYAGVFLALAVGALAAGGVSLGMVLGHWYLVTPRLPERPLRELTAFLLVALVVQALLLAPNLALPRQAIPGGPDVPLGQNPFLWLRIAGGLGLPLLFTYMAYDSSGIRAMQSATGLLYIAMALVLGGEILAKGLMLATAVPS
ncbi:MAG: hypothetical protein NZ695_08850 [Dehalococcoidia bacterium]|nr:hypothetical protein [Dehalococcoidia bacterium]MDW8008906.1 hypothetical protein [Chloroflexota bacterium]